MPLYNCLLLPIYYILMGMYQILLLQISFHIYSALNENVIFTHGLIWYLHMVQPAGIDNISSNCTEEGKRNYFEKWAIKAGRR